MRTIAASICILLALPLLAQRNDQGRWADRPAMLAGGLEIGVPLGEFDDTWGRQMAGIGANIHLPMRRLPIHYGFDFGWARMGSERAEVVVDVDSLTTSTGELIVTCNMFSYHGTARLQPYMGRVSPYFEVMGGLRQFTTRSRVEVEGFDDPLIEQRNENEFIGSAGWAAGVHVIPGKQRNLLLELRLERLNGGRVAYVDPKSIEIDPATGDVSYGTLSSATRMLNITFGVGLRF